MPIGLGKSEKTEKISGITPKMTSSEVPQSKK
jgi:hypothetical protein